MSDNSHLMIKVAKASAVATALDWKVFARQNIQESVMYGVAVGVGCGLGEVIGSQFAAVVPEFGSQYVSSKSTITRFYEVGTATATGLAVNQFFLKNSFNSEEIPMRAGIAVASDFIGEYVADYFGQSALGFFV